MKRAAVLALLIISACTHGSSQPSVPLPQSSGPPVAFVAIGGDETFGTALPRETRFRDSWPQLVYRNSLPARATFTNLATPGATSQSALATQLPIALQLHPTIIVVWLAGDAAAGIPSSTYETNLAAMLQALRANGVERVIVVAGPETDGGAGYDDATRSAARSANAAVVDLTALAAPLGSATNHTAADAIAAVIGPIR
jgi:GDSL-like Lipase/Acylhydrolase family